MVEEIRKKREKLGLTQNKLAKRTGVSQSLIAKLEQKKNIPNYQTIKKIYDYLERKINSSQETAEDVANPNIVSVDPKDSAKKVAEIINEKRSNVVPVEENERFVGVVKNSSLTLVSGETPVEEIMDYTFSIIPHGTSGEVAENLLKYNDIILVQKECEIIGFISEKELL